MEQQKDDKNAHFSVGGEAERPKTSRAALVAACGFALGCVLAGGSLAYHLLVYIPERDGELSGMTKPQSRAEVVNTESSELDRQASLAAAEAERLRNEQADKQRSQAEEANRQAMRRVTYQTCLTNAETAYTRRWDSQCRLLSETNAEGREKCIRDSPSIRDYCITLYPEKPPIDCTLPTENAREYQRLMDADKARCLAEMNAGLL